jgi:tetratricopeptide (TPR) repeat protein
VLWVLAIGAVWVPIAYFPHSNIPVLLPTVRAERFWYLPAVGTSLLIALGLWRALRGTGGDAPEHEDAAEPAKRNFGLAPRLVLVFFAVNALKARAHAFDYRDDLAFWSSTRQAAPNSAKAHLNYSVMVGARNRLDERLEANRRALDLAPTWAMAWIYYGDTLCRLKRIDEACPHYKKGFELAPNDPNLVALSLQCLWDHGAIASRSDELLDLAARHPGSWLAFLASDIVYSGKEHGGVQKKYRPRSYDEGPRTE